MRLLKLTRIMMALVFAVGFAPFESAYAGGPDKAKSAVSEDAAEAPKSSTAAQLEANAKIKKEIQEAAAALDEKDQTEVALEAQVAAAPEDVQLQNRLKEIKADKVPVSQCKAELKALVNECKGALRSMDDNVNRRMAIKFSQYKKNNSLISEFKEGGAMYSEVSGYVAEAKGKCADAQFDSVVRDETTNKCNCLDHKDEIQSPEGQAVLTKYQKLCTTTFTEAQTHLSTTLATAMDVKRQFQHNAKLAMGIGGAVVAVGAGLAIHNDNQQDKKRDKAKKEAEKNLAEGIIKNADGTKTECFTTASFMKLECRDTLTRLCQSDAKAGQAGCVSFNSNYCQGEGASSSYCLSKEGATYCGQSGAQVSNSPACAWANAKPAICKTQPEHASCMYGGTGDALNLACRNYPNDPLCKAHATGRIVTAGGTAPATTPAGTGTTTTMNDIYNNGSISSSTTQNPASPDLLSSSTNLWASSSSNVQQACAAGNLTGCP